MKYQQYLLPCLGWIVGSTGCVDANSAYDDYASRLIDADVRVYDGAIVSELPDVNGDFLMTVRPDLAEKRLLFLRIAATFQPVTANTGLLGYRARFLDLTTMEPIGEEFVADDIEVGTDASFDDGVMEGILPAAANSITGSNAPVDGLLIGTLINDDFVCGTLAGTAGGLALDGTIYAWVRITGSELPPPVWRCEDQPGL